MDFERACAPVWKGNSTYTLTLNKRHCGVIGRYDLTQIWNLSSLHIHVSKNMDTLDVGIAPLASTLKLNILGLAEADPNKCDEWQRA